MGEVKLPNPHLDSMGYPHTFHLGIDLNQDTARIFEDVKFVCIGGTSSRMRSTCVRLASHIYDRNIEKDEQFDYLFENERYSGYKAGAVLCVNHGMGLPSVSIMLHELFKVLSCAGCRDVTVIRIGTCGGVGVTPGTVIVTQEALDPDLKPLYNTSSFGVRLSLPVKCDVQLIDQLVSVSRDDQSLKDIPVVAGKTYCVDDFYQGQGRLDGSFCDKTVQDRKRFLTRLYDHGVRNIEMESAGVLALTHKVGIKGAVVCAALVNRLESDFVEAPTEQVQEWIDRPITLVVQFIKSKIFPAHRC